MESSFIAIYCESNFYKNYEEISEEKRKSTIPLVLMLSRWDGKIGFIGGHIDEGETPLSCVIRELQEEIGYSLPEEFIHNVNFVCCHSLKNHKTYLYTLKVNEVTFRNILKGQHEAVHYLAEGTAFASHFINYPHNPSFTYFMRNHFAPTVKEEIYELVKYLGWIDTYHLFFE